MTENELVKQHLGLVIKITKSFNPKDDAEMQDMIQEGSIALLRAIRAHDAKKGKVSTLAWEYIRRAIYHYRMKKQVKNRQERLHSVLLYNKEPLWEIIPNTLTSIELLVINMRSEGYTFQEIGDKIGYTKSWISRVFNNAKTKIIQANE